ncbi:MAG: hypothetical protein ACI8SE_000040 [Bacteroidia bacterium]|jgi:hypothetical protein
MKIGWITIFYLLASPVFGQLTISNIGSLPEPVSNNAVIEGWIDQTPYLYSFAGIDTTKSSSGIHLKCFRVNLSTGVPEVIAPLPDTLGKIACGVSRLRNVIYITGGYHVYSNGNEKSSNKVHRYDVEQNLFLTDASSIPVATDDHVQAVWRDSLIFLITGWSDVTNIPNVQIYNPAKDTWSSGTSVPNNNAYKSFGASGTIIVDTIFYFGGASSATGFKIQSWLRKGIINRDNPNEISWSFSSPDPSITSYRAAPIVLKNQAYWVGGSATTYNYNGIAYDGTGGVNPHNFQYTWNGNVWEKDSNAQLPMDLRGIAKINDSLAYLAGGMSNNQEVTASVLKLKWGKQNTSVAVLPQSSISVYPNPCKNYINVDIVRASNKPLTITVYNIYGQALKAPITSSIVDMHHLPAGMYQIKIKSENMYFSKLILKN